MTHFVTHIQNKLFFAAQFLDGPRGDTGFVSFLHFREFGMEERARSLPKVVERRALVKDPRENDKVTKRISRSCSVVKRNFSPSSREGVTSFLSSFAILSELILRTYVDLSSRRMEIFIYLSRTFSSSFTENVHGGFYPRFRRVCPL